MRKTEKTFVLFLVRSELRSFGLEQGNTMSDLPDPLDEGLPENQLRSGAYGRKPLCSRCREHGHRVPVKGM